VVSPLPGGGIGGLLPPAIVAGSSISESRIASDGFCAPDDSHGRAGCCSRRLVVAQYWLDDAGGCALVGRFYRRSRGGIGSIAIECGGFRRR
jgi:hypothetical protein